MPRRVNVSIREDLVLALERVAEREGVPVRTVIERVLEAAARGLSGGDWSSAGLLLLELMAVQGAGVAPLHLLDELPEMDSIEAAERARILGYTYAREAAAIIRDSLGKIDGERLARQLAECVTRVVPQARSVVRGCIVYSSAPGLGGVASSYFQGVAAGLAEGLGCRVRVHSTGLIEARCCEEEEGGGGEGEA